MALEKKPTQQQSKTNKSCKKSRRTAGSGSRNSTRNKTLKLIRVHRKYTKLALAALRRHNRLLNRVASGGTLSVPEQRFERHYLTSQTDLLNTAKSEFDKACAHCTDPVAVIRAQKVVG